jgi:polyisoprenoid-binding protein YceI
MNLPRSIILCGGLCLFACKNPAAEAPKAEVRAPAPAEQETAPAGQEAIALSSDTVKVAFVGSKVTGSHEGGFERVSGAVHLSPEGLLASRIEVDIDMTSVFSDSARLTGHLKNDDFFLVEQHPTARFVSTRVDRAEDGRHTITGNLTLRGVTKALSFPAAISVTDQLVKADAEFALPRKQFGVAYEGKPDDLIRDEVLVKLSVAAPRQAKVAGP